MENPPDNGRLEPRSIERNLQWTQLQDKKLMMAKWIHEGSLGSPNATAAAREIRQLRDRRGMI